MGQVIYKQSDCSDRCLNARHCSIREKGSISVIVTAPIETRSFRDLVH